MKPINTLNKDGVTLRGISSSTKSSRCYRGPAIPATKMLGEGKSPSTGYIQVALFIYLYKVYLYIYDCVCVCVCVITKKKRP